MGLTQTGSNLAASLTGNVNKAYILLPTAKSEWGLEEAVNAAPGEDPLLKQIEGEADRLRTAASRLQTAAGLAGGNNLSVFGVNDRVLEQAKQAGFLPVQVQYNPSSLSLDGNAGQSIRESAGGGSESQFAQSETPVETNLKVDLIFDAVNIKDAFMWDNARVFTAGDILQKAKQMAGERLPGENDGSAKKGPAAVHETVEIFVGAILKAQSRTAGFVWNRMVFWGEMFGVSAQYTMFNRDGNPVRAKVTIQIRQDQAGSGTEYESERYWKKAYEKLFLSAYEGGAQDSVSNFGALLQL